MPIPFNVAPVVGTEVGYLQEVLSSRQLTGDKVFVGRCREWFERHYASPSLLTGSCTHALEMAALLTDLGPGDEVITSSFTFSSTANAVALRGARLVFVDIRPDTMNIDETLLEAAVTDKTKAIVPVHYGGVACEMDTINEIAAGHGLTVIEDAAQCLMASYRGTPLGALGHYGALSFHPTKNYTAGEGGLLIVGKSESLGRAEILREKGTNRQAFFRGDVDKYTWVDLGSSYVMSELSAAVLWAQLERADDINSARLELWARYSAGLSPLVDKGHIEVQSIPDGCQHNAHIFYIKARDLDERGRLIAHLKDHDVQASFHFVPLHSSPAGERYGHFSGDDVFTTVDSNRLVRLPLFYDLGHDDQDKVIDLIHSFYSG